MKKIALISLLAIALPIVALAVQAAPDYCVIKGTNPTKIGIPACTTAIASNASSACDFVAVPECGMCCVLNTVYNVTDWIFIFLVVIVAVFVLIGAFNFITSAGDPEKTKSGRNYILYAAVGLAVAFLAKAVPGLVRLATGF